MPKPWEAFVHWGGGAYEVSFVYFVSKLGFWGGSCTLLKNKEPRGREKKKKWCTCSTVTRVRRVFQLSKSLFLPRPPRPPSNNPMFSHAQATLLAFENRRIKAEGQRAVKAVEAEAVKTVGALSAELHKLRTNNNTVDGATGGFPSDIVGGYSWRMDGEATEETGRGGGERDRCVVYSVRWYYFI